MGGESVKVTGAPAHEESDVQKSSSSPHRRSSFSSFLSRLTRKRSSTDSVSQLEKDREDKGEEKENGEERRGAGKEGEQTEGNEKTPEEKYGALFSLEGKKLSFPIIDTALTPVEESVLKEIKTRFLPYLNNHPRYDDTFFFRFCRARLFDLKKTSVMIAAYIDWRIECNVDNICITEKFDFVEKISEFYPRNFTGTDREGRPLYLEQLGRLNVKKVLQTTDFNELVRYYIQEYEQLINIMLPACRIKHGKNVSQNMAVIDLKGLKLSQFTAESRSVLKKLSHITQNFYPELLNQMFLLNPPTIFSIVWAFAHSLIDSKTASKICVIKNVADATQAAKFNEAIYPAEVPSGLGGFRDAPNWQNERYGPWYNKDILIQIHKERPFVPLNLFFGVDPHDEGVQPADCPSCCYYQKNKDMLEAPPQKIPQNLF